MQNESLLGSFSGGFGLLFYRLLGSRWFLRRFCRLRIPTIEPETGTTLEGPGMLVEGDSWVGSTCAQQDHSLRRAARALGLNNYSNHRLKVYVEGI